MTADALVLRHAALADVERVAELELTCFTSDPWPRQSFESFIDRAGVTFIVAEDPGSGEGIVGYAVLIQVAEEAELLNLAVAGDSRRSGIGSSLLRSLLEVAARDGIRTVYLEVRESNAAARGLYAAHGFVEVGRRRRYYQRPEEDALILQRVGP
ncbi:MAG: ribosomal protein S18-alanine N-acetyltransferase [Gemmatimonadaceae bacterium]